MPRLEEACAEERGNRRVGSLPMRSVSNAGHFQQRSFACPCIFALGRKAGSIERCCCQLQNAALCNREIFQDIRLRNSNTSINTLLLQHRPCHLCYDEHTQVHGAQHRAGRRRGGLCGGPRSGDRPAAPAGAGDLPHPQAAVSARRRGAGRPHGRTHQGATAGGR